MSDPPGTTTRSTIPITFAAFISFVFTFVPSVWAYARGVPKPLCVDEPCGHDHLASVAAVMELDR